MRSWSAGRRTFPGLRDREAHVDTRRVIFSRQITCVGYLRNDGNLDIEGELTDIRSAETKLRFKTVAAGQPFHHMRLVMTVDEHMVIQAFEARTDAGPTPECAAINDAYGALAGLTIGAGFLGKARVLVGGAGGCTHLTDMLPPMATAAVQARWSTSARRGTDSGVGDATQAERPWIIDSCYGYRRDGEAVKIMWPQHYDATAGSGRAKRGTTGEAARQAGDKPLV